eukprot:6954282-Prymnesium_polylepis.1
MTSRLLFRIWVGSCVLAVQPPSCSCLVGGAQASGAQSHTTPRARARDKLLHRHARYNAQRQRSPQRREAERGGDIYIGYIVSFCIAVSPGGATRRLDLLITVRPLIPGGRRPLNT